MNLYIDFDGVIADTITEFYSDLEKTKPLKDYKAEEIEEYMTNFPWEKFDLDKLIINDSINCISKINDTGKFNISILTHIYTLKEGIIKIEYLRKYLKNVTIILCPKKISKTKMIKVKDSILVDDYSGNLREWEKEGGIAIKFSTKKQSKNFRTIDKLDKLIDMF